MGGELVVQENLDWMNPVERWRFNAFGQLGFDPQSSVRLAISQAVVSQTQRMLERGCSHELALEILL